MGNWTKWTADMHRFLLKNYKKKGDKEIALELQKRFPKRYGWTLKQVERRRYHFGLRRTQKQVALIRKRNTRFGWANNIKKTWDTRGRAEQGEVRIYKGKMFMKAGRYFKPYHRELYQKLVGLVPPGMSVTQDFELISRAELARRNRMSGLGYTGELRDAFEQLKQLKKLINGKEDSRLARHAV